MTYFKVVSKRSANFCNYLLYFTGINTMIELIALHVTRVFQTIHSSSWRYNKMNIHVTKIDTAKMVIVIGFDLFTCGLQTKGSILFNMQFLKLHLQLPSFGIRTIKESSKEEFSYFSHVL